MIDGMMMGYSSSFSALCCGVRMGNEDGYRKSMLVIYSLEFFFNTIY